MTGVGDFHEAGCTAGGRAPKTRQVTHPYSYAAISLQEPAKSFLSAFAVDQIKPATRSNVFWSKSRDLNQLFHDVNICFGGVEIMA